jgi:hypothetical protein
MTEKCFSTSGAIVYWSVVIGLFLTLTGSMLYGLSELCVSHNWLP